MALHAAASQSPEQVDAGLMEDNFGGVGSDEAGAFYLEAPYEYDDRFHSLAELEELEDELSREGQIYGGSSANPHTLLTPQAYRAKLYILTEETRWLDIGTGYFRILLSKDGAEHYMQIV